MGKSPKQGLAYYRHRFHDGTTCSGKIITQVAVLWMLAYQFESSIVMQWNHVSFKTATNYGYQRLDG